MEITRHFTATVYIVHKGATALHEHEQLGRKLPPAGHIDRDELPHQAGMREVKEETGLEPTLIDNTEEVPTPGGRVLPEPRHYMLYDINVHDGKVGHQHVDHVYYATVENRDISPEPGEAGEEAWNWYTIKELEVSELPLNVIQFGTEAIQAAETKARTERSIQPQ